MKKIEARNMIIQWRILEHQKTLGGMNSSGQ